jgi:integrase
MISDRTAPCLAHRRTGFFRWATRDRNRHRHAHPGLRSASTFTRCAKRRATRGEGSAPSESAASGGLTAGIQLGYVSQQLGHADVAVTARHYARWCGGDGYREAMRVALGEVPADLLGRLESHQSPTSPPSRLRAVDALANEKASESEDFRGP